MNRLSVQQEVTNFLEHFRGLADLASSSLHAVFIVVMFIVHVSVYSSLAFEVGIAQFTLEMLFFHRRCLAVVFLFRFFIDLRMLQPQVPQALRPVNKTFVATFSCAHQIFLFAMHRCEVRSEISLLFERART